MKKAQTKKTQTRLAISYPISAWTKGPKGISAHTYTLTIYLKGNPLSENGWIFPRPQLQKLIEKKTHRYQGFNSESSPYELLKSIGRLLKNSKISPLLEALSLSWVTGQRIYINLTNKENSGVN